MWQAAKCAGAILALMCVVAAGGCSSSVAAPTNYKTWNATDGTFALEYPEDWDASGGGKNGVQWAEFKQGSARISIRVSLVSSLLGDIAQSAGTMAGANDPFSEIDPELAKEMAPVSAAHENGKDMFTKEFSRYKEQDSVAYESGFGDSRKSEFTARSGLSGKLRGYRATVLGRDRGVHICCWCKDSNWQALQPAFDQILAGMRQGTPP